MAESERDGIWSLPLLQSRIKRDAEAYRAEYFLQYEHFGSALEMFRAAPHRAERAFQELVMFLAHTSANYFGQTERLVASIISLLVEQAELIHPLSRRALVNALLLMRGRKSITLMRILPTLFELMDIKSKSLRKQLMAFIVRDVTRNKLLKPSSGQLKTQIQTLLLSAIQSMTHEGRAKRASRIAIELYRRDAWRDNRLIHALAEAACLSPFPKVCMSAVNFLLGRFKPISADDGDTSGEDDAPKPRREIVGATKTKSRLRKLKREKASDKRAEERKERKQAVVLEFTGTSILDALNNPEALAERIFARVTSNKNQQKDPFALRLQMANLVSRLIGKFHLLIPNFHPFLQRYLVPKQRQVPEILAMLVQSSHNLIPPDDLQSVLQVVLRNFVVEHQPSEIIAVGINSIREVASRAPHCLTEDMLADLAEYRKFKDKIVVAATRSLINLYREMYPSMLHRRLRGKDGAIAVALETDNKPAFGQTLLTTHIDGLDLLQQDKVKRGEVEVAENTIEAPTGLEVGDSEDDNDDLDSSDEEDDEDEEEAEDDEAKDGDMSSADEIEGSDEEEEEEEENTGEIAEGDKDAGEVEERVVGGARKRRKLENGDVAPEGLAVGDSKEGLLETVHSAFLMNEILTPDDFKRLGKLKARRQARLEKEAAGVEWDSGEGTSVEEGDEESDSETSEDETNSAAVVNPEDLASTIKRRGRHHRLAAVRAGKEEKKSFAESLRVKKSLAKKKSSLPNSVKARNKPLMMTKQNRRIKHKHQQDAGIKVKSIRAHIKNIKKETGGRRKYRRG